MGKNTPGSYNNRDTLDSADPQNFTGENNHENLIEDIEEEEDVVWERDDDEERNASIRQSDSERGSVN